jgi:hypothetical protein
MKNLSVSILFLLFAWSIPAQDTFQLAPPLLKYPSIFFTAETLVEIAFTEPNTRIHYTLNGQEPTEKAAIYTTPIRITDHFTTLKARVFAEKYRPSDVVQASFIQAGLPIKSLEGTPPHPRYKGSGAKTLYDNQGGNNYISGHTWQGFQTDTVEIVLNLYKKHKVKKVLLNLLRDYGSWIFLPEKIEVYAWDHKNKVFRYAAGQSLEQARNIAGAECIPLELALKKGTKTDKIKIHLHLVKKLPDWHPGKGNKAWIFWDEIKVYEKPG